MFRSKGEALPVSVTPDRAGRYQGGAYVEMGPFESPCAHSCSLAVTRHSVRAYVRSPKGAVCSRCALSQTITSPTV